MKQKETRMEELLHFSHKKLSRYVLYLINNEQVMLTSQFSCSFCRLMHGVERTYGGVVKERNRAKQNVKNENWLQKLIYRISDNKFNSFSLFSFSPSSPKNLVYVSGYVEEVGRSEQLKNYRWFLYCYSLMNYTLKASTLSFIWMVLDAAAASYWWSGRFEREWKFKKPLHCSFYSHSNS